MQVTVEKLSPVLVEFVVKVPADQVKQSMDQAFNELARSKQIRGFRKGRAPRHVLVHLFGDQIAIQVANKLVDDTFRRAVAEMKMQPVSSPVFEKPKAAVGEEYAYRARFEVTPTIETLVYEGLEAKRHVYSVEDSMIAAELERLRTQHATLVAVSSPRPVRKGDVVTLDWTLDVDGKPFEDASVKDVSVEVGGTGVLPAISEALLGKDAGAHVQVDLEFPEGHSQQWLRGKSGRFHVTLGEIKERVLPQLDDEFAKDLGQFDTLDALKQSIREKLGKALKERSENELAEDILAELCKKNPIPVPPSLVEQQSRLQENELLQRVRAQDQNVRSLSPEVRRNVAADAEFKVRAGLIMAEIAKKSGIKINDDDIQKAYEEIAEQTGKNVNKVKAEFKEPKQREMLIGLIVEDKVLDIIESAAKIEDVPAPSQG